MSRTNVDGKAIEWVTLVSQDGYTFVMDKRCARYSIFIRSMLGEGGGSAQQRTKRSEAGGASTSMSMSGLRSEGDSGVVTPINGRGGAALDMHATPPPEESSGAATRTTEEPAGYVNPFAVATGGLDTNDGSGEDTPFVDGFAEARSNVVHLPNIRGVVLEKVVEYLCHTAKYFRSKDVDIPNFEHRIPPELAIELLMAADFLQEG